MAKKKTYKKKKEINQLQEPSVKYNKARIFNSFEESEQAYLKSSAAQNPIDRLSETVELILRAYGVTRTELSKRKTSNQIIILRRQ